MKRYNVNSIGNDELILSGKGDCLLWKKAEILTDFISPWDTRNPKIIEFRSLWNSENIFFCFTVQDESVHIKGNDESIENIGNSDRVELFFRRDTCLNPYYCLEIDPTSRIMDFKAFPAKKFDFDWNWPKKDIEVKSFVGEKHFCVEIAISISSFEKFNLIRDNKIETGIFRAKYNEIKPSIFKPTWITWVNPNTTEPNFHISSSFGVLNLIENKNNE